MKNKSIAFILFLSLSFVLTLYTLYCDRTSYTSNDGMFKATWIQTWMSPSGLKYSKSSHALYFPTMAKLIPYIGFSNHDKLYERIATVNSVFGAATIAVLFLLSTVLGLNRLNAIAASILHLGLAGFLIQISGNDDIIPSYFFFVCSLFFLISFIKESEIKTSYFSYDILLCGLMSSLSLLFHWTSIVAAAPVFCFAILISQKNIKNIIFNSLLYFLSITLPAALCFKLFNFSLIEIFIPENIGFSKAWLSFSPEKLQRLAAGIAEFIVRSKQFYIEDIFKHTVFKLEFFISLGLFGFLFLLILLLIKKNTFSRHQKLFLTVTFFIFIIAQIVNCYHQPDASQFQLQPMFFFTACYIGILISIQKYKHLNFLFLFLLILGSVYNLKVIHQENGRDSIALDNLNRITSHFPLENHLFITLGYDHFTSYHEAERPLILFGLDNNKIDFGMSVELCAKGEKNILHFWNQKLSYAEEKLHQIVIDGTWNLTEDQLVQKFSHLTGAECIISVFQFLKNNYTSKTILKTPTWGEFTLLEKK